MILTYTLTTKPWLEAHPKRLTLGRAAMLAHTQLSISG